MKRRRRTRTIWHSEDGLCYEMRRHFTRSVAEQKAQAFAKSPAFRLTAVRPVKDGVFAVRLYPADHTALYARCERMSQEKLDEQGSEFEVSPAPDGSGWTVHNRKSGGRYLVTNPPDVTCECPHWRGRLEVVGAECKHMKHLRRFGYLDNELELVA